MPREREGFREQLASIIEMFPGNHEFLSIKDVCQYTGRSGDYVTNHFCFNGSGHGQYVTRVQFALQLLPKEEAAS